MVGVGFYHHAHVIIEEGEFASDDDSCFELDFDGDFVFNEAAEVGEEEILSLIRCTGLASWVIK